MSNSRNVKENNDEGLGDFRGYPDETILKILSNLSPRDLFCLCLVSKNFNILASDDSLWKKLLKSGFNISHFIQGVSQKEIFKVHYERHQHPIPLFGGGYWNHTFFSSREEMNRESDFTSAFRGYPKNILGR